MYLELLILLVLALCIGFPIAIALHADEVRQAKQGSGVDVQEGHGSTVIFLILSTSHNEA